MGILVGIIILVAIVSLFCSFSGDDSARQIEEWRRAEYPNEYFWERKKYEQNSDRLFLEAASLRRP